MPGEGEAGDAHLHDDHRRPTHTTIGPRNCGAFLLGGLFWLRFQPMRTRSSASLPCRWVTCRNRSRSCNPSSRPQ
nr:MAG TPA: hypothetical protein [Caudoviricetes sp.]